MYKIVETYNIFAVNPIHPRSGEQIKSTHRRVLSDFVYTTFGKKGLKERGKIELQFSKLKDQGLEPPRWYGHNCYLLRIYFSFATPSS
ncbi:hypothetical protein CN636_06410 [Bacillus toyonensis]|nr:hypothetical protein CN636_06410 [Bacillus toyonensis]